MLKDAADLRIAGIAADLAHDPVQLGGARHPARRLALIVAAIEHQLTGEPANAGGSGKHRVLSVARLIPGRFARGGGVETKDQPAGAIGGGVGRPSGS